jgi:hypothetical protein
MRGVVLCLLIEVPMGMDCDAFFSDDTQFVFA